MICFHLKSLIISIIIILLHVFVVLSQNTSPFNSSNVNNNSNNNSNNSNNVRSSSIAKTTNFANARPTYGYTRSIISTAATSNAVATNSADSNNVGNSNNNYEDTNNNSNSKKFDNQEEIPTISFKDFLQSINFVFIEPKEDAVIYQNRYLDVKWECNYVDEKTNPFRNISVVLENQVDNKGYYIETGIDLNQKQGKYYIGSLNETSREYALWLATGNETEGINFFRGPGIVNGNSIVTSDKKTNVTNIEDDNNQGGLSALKYIILIGFVSLIGITMVVYLLVIAVKNKRKQSEDCKEYQEYKGYTNVSPSINKLLGLDELYEKENRNNTQRQMMSNSTNSIQSINTLAEQLYKAEQVYNNKVLKNPNLNANHCAPLVDMSNLYKASQEITQVNTDNDNLRDNPYYKSKVLNSNKGKIQKGIMKSQNTYGIANSDVNKNGEESFLVFDDNTNVKNKYVSFEPSDSANSSKILAQSESFTSVAETDKDKNDQIQKPFNVLDDNVNNDNDDDSDEDYINKNSFCLNSKDSIDIFENNYLNKQNTSDLDIKESKKNTPLVATVTTVEEYLEAHRRSLREQRHVRSSSLLTSSSNSSSINSIVVSSALNNLPKMNKDSLKNKNSEILDNDKSNGNRNSDSDNINQDNKRISESDNNNSSIIGDNSLNSSILEEINSLERQIQQQRQQQQLYRLQQKSGNYQQNIDPDQLNLQMANLHQQSDSDTLLPSFPNNLNGYNYSNSSVPSQHVQSKGSSNYRSKSTSPAQSILKNRASPQSASTLYSKSPPGKKSFSDSLLQKSQESEATLQVQQNTQDTLPLDDNEDEVETIVATHVCNTYYNPSMPDELRMYPGDELIILERFNDGWGFGQNTRGDLGFFPLDCVSYININNSGGMEALPVHTYNNNNNTNKTTLIQSKVPNINMSDSYDSYNNLSVKQDYIIDSRQDYPLKEDIRSNQNMVYNNNDAYRSRKVYDERNDIFTYRNNSNSSNNSNNNIYQVYNSMHQQMHQQRYNPINQQIYNSNNQQRYNQQYSSTTSPKYKNNQGRTNNVRFGNTQPSIHYY